MVWRPGMATSCEHCGGKDLTYAQDGTARCEACTGITLPVWASRERVDAAPRPDIPRAPQETFVRPPLRPFPPWWVTVLTGAVVGALVGGGIVLATQPAPPPAVAITEQVLELACVPPANITRYTFDFWVANFGRRNALVELDFGYGNGSQAVGLFLPAVTSIHGFAQFNSSTPSPGECPMGPISLQIGSVEYR